MLDQLNSEDDAGAGRIEQLEGELERVRNAFEEYLSTTENLEIDVEKELHEMQSKLNSSTVANQELAEKLRSMETLFKNLELSSERTKEKLKTEAKLRRQAEKALTETELELRNKNVRIRQLERHDSSALRMVDSGVITEMANNTSKFSSDRELEVVTEELITTQEDLRKAEVQLQRSQALVQHLERNLQKIDDESPESLSGDDKELLRELDEIRAEINGTKSEQKSKFESQLEEKREESSWLGGAMLGLRKIYDQVATTGVADEKSESESTASISLNKEEKAGHQFEIQSLRKQLEATWNENLVLQEKVQKLEFVGSSQADPIELVDDDIIGVKFADEGLTIDEKLRKTELMLQKSREECSGMRNEILALTESLYNAIQSREEAIVSSKEIINVIASKAKEDQVLTTQNEVEKKEKEIMNLEKTLTTSQEKVRLLSLEIARMSSAFEETQDKYDIVAEDLKRTENALAAAKDTKDAEIHALKVQFKELDEKNESLVSQVKNAETELLSAIKKQDEASAETEARVQTLKELRDDVDQAVNDTTQRNRDVEELALNMEKRMSGAERNVEKIESNIASFTSAIETLQTAQAAAALVEESTPSESTPSESTPSEEEAPSQSVESNPEGQFNDDDASASTEKPRITKSMHTMRSHSKFDEIIEKVAKYEAQSLHSREIRELELAPVEVSTEERE